MHRQHALQHLVFLFTLSSSTGGQVRKMRRVESERLWFAEKEKKKLEWASNVILRQCKDQLGWA